MQKATSHPHIHPHVSMYASPIVIRLCVDCLTLCLQEKSSGRSAHYKLTSTAMLWLQTNKEGSGTMNLGGSLTRQVQQPPTYTHCAYSFLFSSVVFSQSYAV